MEVQSKRLRKLKHSNPVVASTAIHHSTVVTLLRLYVQAAMLLLVVVQSEVHGQLASSPTVTSMAGSWQVPTSEGYVLLHTDPQLSG